MTLRFRKRIFMAPEGGNDGGTATATPAPAAPAAPEPGQQDNANPGIPASTPATGLLKKSTPGGEPPDPSPASPSPDPASVPTPGQIADRPEYIAEQFWNVESGVPKVEELSKSYNELRNQNNKLMADKGKGAPEKAEDYLTDYKPPLRSRPSGDQKEGDVMDRYGDLDAADPVFVAMAKFAKNGNMSPANFTDGMQELMEALHPLLPEPFNAETEAALLGEGAEQMIKINEDWVNGLAGRGILNEKQHDLLLGFSSTAAGVELVNILRQNSGEKPIPKNLNGGIPTGVKTGAECAAMMEDDRYRADGPAGDAFRAEVDKEFAKTHGTGPA